MHLGKASEGIDKPIVTPQFPMIFDLSSDPGDAHNMFVTRFDNAWMLAPVFRNVVQYQMSLKKFPNIKVGEDFKGYQEA